MLNQPERSHRDIAGRFGLNESTVRKTRWRLQHEGWSCRVAYGTCARCGQQLTHSVIGRATRRYHASCRRDVQLQFLRRNNAKPKNREQQKKRWAAARDRNQHASLSKASRRMTRWTEEEDAVLIELAERPVMETSDRLGRSFAAVAMRRTHLRQAGRMPPARATSSSPD